MLDVFLVYILDDSVDPGSEISSTGIRKGMKIFIYHCGVSGNDFNSGMKLTSYRLKLAVQAIHPTAFSIRCEMRSVVNITTSDIFSTRICIMHILRLSLA